MNTLEYLKLERKELSQRISALSLFIHISPKYKGLSGYCKKLLSLQLEFMNGYSLLLDLRINDIELSTTDNRFVKCGKWELTNKSKYRKCSVCGAWWGIDITKNPFTEYCPTCGARMDDKNNE